MTMRSGRYIASVISFDLEFSYCYNVLISLFAWGDLKRFTLFFIYLCIYSAPAEG